MIRWALHIRRKAMQSLYQIPKELVPGVVAAMQSLTENPLPTNAQPSASDPSVYWIAAAGDYVISYEIIDERHSVVILLIN